MDGWMDTDVDMNIYNRDRQYIDVDMNIDIAPADLYAASHGKPGDAGKHRRGVKIDRRCTHAESSSRNLHATTQTKALAAGGAYRLGSLARDVHLVRRAGRHVSREDRLGLGLRLRPLWELGQCVQSLEEPTQGPPALGVRCAAMLPSMHQCAAPASARDIM